MKPTLLVLTLLAACGTEPPPAPVQPATGPAAPTEATPPTPTDAATPPTAPPPGEGSMQGQPTFQVTPGEGVQLSGTITYAGTVTRPIRLDIFQSNPSAENPNATRILHAAKLDQAGAWSIEAPKGTGTVDITVFIDVDNNGPSESEPQASLKGVSIADVALTGLDLTLVDPPGFVAPEPLAPDTMGGKPAQAPPTPPTGDAPPAPSTPAAPSTPPAPSSPPAGG